MRDAQAFEFEFLINHEVRAEVHIEQSAVRVADRVERLRAIAALPQIRRDVFSGQVRASHRTGIIDDHLAVAFVPGGPERVQQRVETWRRIADQQLAKMMLDAGV